MKKVLFVLVIVSLLTMACLPLKTIYAKSLCDADYDPTEWHFVITGIKNKASAPKSIQVKFLRSDGVKVWKTVPLLKYTGKTAHYTWYGNLQASVIKAKASIYPGWSGQFNLSHGPMNCEARVTWTVDSDCEGWSIAFLRNGEPAGGESGLWADFVTDESFTFVQSIYGKLYKVFISEPQECFDVCEETYVSEWTPFEGAGIDKTSYREYRDVYTNEVCNTEFREKCVSDKVVHFWTDGWCMFRDRTYPDNASWMVNPPVFMQMAYCGCDYTPFGEWGIVEVNECDVDGFKYWMELTPYCGYTDCR